MTLVMDRLVHHATILQMNVESYPGKSPTNIFASDLGIATESN
jgi:hypothetical protein